MDLLDILNKRKQELCWTTVIKLSGYGRSTMDKIIKTGEYTKKQYDNIKLNLEMFSTEFAEDLQELKFKHEG